MVNEVTDASKADPGGVEAYVMLQTYVPRATSFILHCTLFNLFFEEEKHSANVLKNIETYEKTDRTLAND